MVAPALPPRVVVPALGVATLAVTGAAVRLRMLHHEQRWPFATWTTADAVVELLAILSAVAAVAVAVWLVRRLPTNPSGAWLALAALAFAGWLAGTHWPHDGGPWAERLLPPVVDAAAVLAVLPWPTGRLERRWARPVRSALAGYVVASIGLEFVGRRYSPWVDPATTLPAIGDLAEGHLIRAMGAVVLGVVAPGILMIALVRRHQSMPATMRAAARPAFVGVALMALVVAWGAVADQLLAPVSRSGGLGRSVLDHVRAAAGSGRLFLVAATLVVAERQRTRFGRTVGRELRLTTTTTGDPDPAVLIGDPTARLVLGAPSDDGSGEPGRSRILLADPSGEVCAWIDHDASVSVTPDTVDVVVGAMGLTVLRAARRREVDGRTAQIRVAQRQVIEAQDRARRTLERDLHDGLQQRLVALTLHAGRLARAAGANGTIAEADRDRVVADIDDTLALAHEVVAEGVPGVLDPGLSAALHVLGASVPVPTSVAVDGDVPSSDPLALTLWFVASEAVANSLKHGRAHELTLQLIVDDDAVELVVTDDGVGGAAMPAAILARLDPDRSQLVIESPPGGGTRLYVRVERDPSAERTQGPSAASAVVAMP